MNRVLLSLAALMLLVTSCFLFKTDIEFDGGKEPSFTFDKNGGESLFSFKATGEWTASSSDPWCSITPVSGNSGHASVTVKVPANDRPEDRSAVITLQCVEVVKTVSVMQAQRDMFTLVSQTVDFPYKAGHIDFQFDSNVPVYCDIVEGEDWLSQTKALERMSISFYVTENTGEVARKGVIEAYNKEAGLSATITVIQQAPDVFELSSSETNVSYEGGSFTVTVRSSLSYSVSSMPGWVKEVSVKSVTGKTHTFAVSANPDQEEREGVIVFCNESGVCVPFTVYQEAAPEPEPEPSGVDWKKSFVHKSLIMRFTATWCGYCPTMAETVALAQANRPGRYEVVNIHGGSSDLEFSKYRPLLNEYKITGYPTSVVDGRRRVDNYNPSYGVVVMESVQDETESNYETVTTVGINSSYSGNSLLVNVDVYCKAADSYKVTVMVLEDGIVGYQAGNYNGSHSDYVHDAVARIALSDVLGDAFSTVEENTQKSFSYKVDVPTDYVKDNLRVLVYVQREFGKQQKLSDFASEKFYVDNAASVKTGVKLEPAVK